MSLAPYISYRLKATSKTKMNNALVNAGVAAIEGGALQATEGNAIDVLGVWSENTGTAEEPVMTPLPGYHVNVLTSEPVAFTGVTLKEPGAPWRVWAGENIIEGELDGEV